MIILVLGGTGFVGKSIVKNLERKHKLFIASRRSGVDLMDYKNTIEAFENFQPEIIINCAAHVGSLNYVTERAAEVFDTNMRMVLNIFKAIHNTVPNSTLINPIANCAYPGGLNEYKEEDFWSGRVHDSVTAYGNTRRMIDVISNCYEMQFGQKTINLIVPNMYGPFDSTDPNKAHALNALVSKVVKAKAEKQKFVEVWGSGIAIREWLFSSDFAKVVEEILNNLKKFYHKEPFNVAQNYGLSIRELIEIIVEETKYTGKIKWNRNMPDGAPRKVMYDKRFRKLFPFYKFTDLEIGLIETVKYYEKCYPY